MDGEAYLVVLGAATVAWAVVVVLAPRVGLRAIGLGGGLAIALFALAPPLHSLDVFSYISYARLGVEAGLSPYEAVPADLGPGDEAASLVDDWRFAVSVYGPAFTLGSYPLGAVSVPVALWVLKAAAAASLAAIAWLVARLAPGRGLDPSRSVAVVALNPLALVHVVGGAHNDGLMVLAVTAALALLLTGRELAGGGSIALAAAIKASGALVAPFALLGELDRRRLIAGALAAGIAIVLSTLAAFGSGFAEAAGLVGDNQALSSRYSVPSTVARAGGLDADAVRITFGACYAVLVLALLAWTWRGADWVRAAAWATVGLLVATAWMVPWYVLWALPFAALVRDRALLVAVFALSAFQVPNALPL